MPRRLKMKAEDLPDLVVDAAERAARAHGLRGIIMRQLAMEVGVVPGSLYKFVGSIDDIILILNARTLRRLQLRLQSAAATSEKGVEAAAATAEAYLQFGVEDPQLWSVLLEHRLPEGMTMPAWYEEELARTTQIVDSLLEPAIPESQARRSAVAILWAALHGIASLSTSGKLAMISAERPAVLVRLLVSRFLNIPA